ncbi:cyclic nucleotide-binding domain-containing protein [Aphanothece sacrum]|uniref:Cyclic nucleotide-binding protein n=1 Tax=Aphanothece sacrum FPU1 TaxID=1920663 RepID=A0A401ICJ0_APHSA|nr:cyclic nucleotide-binding domain-containing protein [Aphanothece sacrum]GBF78954.1 cyclic nucleotide-binding protein [Aphanothece sacrum FPU1]GBF86698.1 cyclic nucleotide-binding domain protein [Aphanothece sacrum FPU3]
MFNVVDGLTQINKVLENIKFPIGTNEISLIYWLQIVFYLIFIVVLTNYFNRILNLNLHIRKIIEIGKLKKLKESDIVFRENDPGDAFYVILEGSVEIFTKKLGKTLAILQTGNFFGELALILGIRRSATVKALEDTLLFSINSKQFEKILRDNSILHELIIQELAKNQEELHKRREELRKHGLLTSDEENTHIVAWLRKRLNNILNF